MIKRRLPHFLKMADTVQPPTQGGPSGPGGPGGPSGSGYQDNVGQYSVSENPPNRTANGLPMVLSN